jgi:hypothetical protein
LIVPRDIFPDYLAPAVRNDGGDREMVMMPWGRHRYARVGRLSPTSATPNQRIGDAGSNQRTGAWCRQTASPNSLPRARVHVAKLLKMMPGFTIREADAYYQMFCFQPAFIEKMNGARRKAELPE